MYRRPLRFFLREGGRLYTGYSWRDHVTNEDLYGHLPKVSSKIRERPMRAAGHCLRHKEKEHRRLCCGSYNTDKLREEDLEPRTHFA